jgi:hypothetical protein
MIIAGADFVCRTTQLPTNTRRILKQLLLNLNINPFPPVLRAKHQMHQNIRQRLRHDRSPVNEMNPALSGLPAYRGTNSQGCALGCRILPFQGINCNQEPTRAVVKYESARPVTYPFAQRIVSSALKGRNMIAQGAALGNGLINPRKP